jgi:hypothetical protein
VADSGAGRRGHMARAGGGAVVEAWSSGADPRAAQSRPRFGACPGVAPPRGATSREAAADQ